VGNLQSDYLNLHKWILNVDFTFIEIILVIDKVKKSDKVFVEQLQADIDNSRFKIIYGVDSGPGSARNIGLGLASAPWISFWDSDDLPDHENVLRCLLESDCSNFDAIVGAYEIFDSTSGRSETHIIEANSEREKLLIAAINPAIWRICFKANSIENLRFPEIYVGEDQVFIAKFLNEEPHIKFTETLFYKYQTGHPGQLTRNKRKKQDLIIAISKILEITSKSENQDFTKIQIVRLAITAALRGNLKTRISIIRIFISKNPFWSKISVAELIRIIKFIRKNRNVS
jgi:glycosyltransferase involved in cell wall biosynthesis